MFVQFILFRLFCLFELILMLFFRNSHIANTLPHSEFSGVGKPWRFPVARRVIAGRRDMYIEKRFAFLSDAEVIENR